MSSLNSGVSLKVSEEVFFGGSHFELLTEICLERIQIEFIFLSVDLSMHAENLYTCEFLSAECTLSVTLGPYVKIFV